MPNIGPACARDLLLIGITEPAQLKGKDADELYGRVCAATGVRHDPCLRDVFESAISFVNGNAAQKWWHFTPGRKERDRLKS